MLRSTRDDDTEALMSNDNDAKSHRSSTSDRHSHLPSDEDDDDDDKVRRLKAQAMTFAKSINKDHLKTFGLIAVICFLLLRMSASTAPQPEVHVSKSSKNLRYNSASSNSHGGKKKKKKGRYDNSGDEGDDRYTNNDDKPRKKKSSSSAVLPPVLTLPQQSTPIIQQQEQQQQQILPQSPPMLLSQQGGTLQQQQQLQPQQQQQLLQQQFIPQQSSVAMQQQQQQQPLMLQQGGLIGQQALSLPMQQNAFLQPNPLLQPDQQNQLQLTPQALPQQNTVLLQQEQQIQQQMALLKQQQELLAALQQQNPQLALQQLAGVGVTTPIAPTTIVATTLPIPPVTALMPVTPLIPDPVITTAITNADPSRPTDADMVKVAAEITLSELGNFAEAWDPFDTKMNPIFWHIPKAGGSSVKDAIGSCHRLVMATEFGVTDGHINDNEIAIVYPKAPGDAKGDRSPFVNVDTTTVAGITRAKQMGFADSGLAQCVVTPFLWEANELFTQTAKGRLFAVFRNPVGT